MQADYSTMCGAENIPRHQLDHLTSEKSWTRDRVCCRCEMLAGTFPEQSGACMRVLTFVSIVRDTRVTALVGTRECNEVARGGRATAGNLKLMASRVELCAWVSICRVQGDDLVANEVVARLEAGGDGVLDSGIASNHQGRL